MPKPIDLGEPFGVVKWHNADVDYLSEQMGLDWSDERVDRFIEQYNNKISDRLTELGWEVIEVFMSMSHHE